MKQADLPIISVIIPLYNGADKIGNCLKHLDSQTFDKPFEVIIIDDASPDHSGDIVEQIIDCLNCSQRFRVIRCRENGRAGRARNIGIREARGEYVLFIDQDDYPDDKLLETLYSLTENGRFDCTACDVADKDGTELHRYPCGRIESLKFNDRKQMMMESGYVFAFLIRKQIIESNDLFFPEGVMFEDSLYNHGVLSCIKSINTTDRVLYYRDDDENSQTASFTIKKLQDRVKATEIYLEKFQLSHSISAFLKPIKLEAFYYIYLSCILWMIRDEDLYDKEFFYYCYKKGHELNIQWDEVFEYQKNMDRRYLIVLKAIYYVPQIRALFLLRRKIRNRMKKVICKDNEGKR